jgi:hypothetical protein
MAESFNKSEGMWCDNCGKTTHNTRSCNRNFNKPTKKDIIYNKDQNPKKVPAVEFTPEEAECIKNFNFREEEPGYTTQEKLHAFLVRVFDRLEKERLENKE